MLLQSAEEAWITFATPNYFALLEVTIASVHSFSSHSIIAVGINCDISFSTQQYPMLIKKRVDVDLSGTSIFLQKPRIIFEPGLKYGIYIEADDVLAKNCDALFEYAHLAREYPLCPWHPNPSDNQYGMMNILAVKEKTMPYVHWHVVFSEKCMPFVEEWLVACREHILKAPNYDETILNVLLWKHRVTEYLPLYDPYFEKIYPYSQLSDFERDEVPYCCWKMFHGCKHPPTSWQILEMLQKL